MAAKDVEQDKEQDFNDGAVILDMSQAAVKKMIAQAKARGYITHDELNQVLPSEQVSSEQIEDVMALLSDMGITVVDGDEAEGEEEDKAPEAGEESRDLVAVSGNGGESLDRTDDPVRMYLREMGSVELLSREGEIAIAKRIEAGRNTMIAGLCESPLTFQAITIWRDELLEGKILLRDVIDLEATFGASLEEETAEEEPDRPRRARPPEPPRRRRGSRSDEDEQSNLSLSAMEKRCADRFSRRSSASPRTTSAWRRCRTAACRHAEPRRDLLGRRRNALLASSGEDRGAVNELHLHNNRIEALVEQLYGINKRIMALDSAMVKLADQARIDRREFIEQYRGTSSIPPGWTVSASSGRGWAELAPSSRTGSRRSAHEMAADRPV
ncbi:MAG: hypothetical protein KatS3mg118_2025 [Paracoccaceae bacterium]|nr:MAG: hypothetical protein KatS3mg118_2025 [Paracoccaceae bacterium]